MPTRSLRRALAVAALLPLLPSLASAQGAPAAAAPSTAATPRLIPAPREIASADGPVRFASVITIGTLAESHDREAARQFVADMRARGVQAEYGVAGRGWPVTLLRTGTREANELLREVRLAFDAPMREEGYVLVATPRGATVVAASAAGIFYGLQTLKQLFTGAGDDATLTPALIRDWPAMRWRGVQDDLARGPVPSIAYQKQQVQRFAELKLNVYVPYFEQMLEFRSHPLLAPRGGAITRGEMEELIEYAAARHVMVIPQQQTFGHLHHLLKHELYAPLAETPHGHVLAPGQPGSLAFVRDVFAEIDSLFPAPFVHLGADETFELGKGQTKPRVDSAGIGPVYLDYLRTIVETVRRPGKRYLFWGDIAMNHPALVPSLPKDMVAVAWEYGASKGFDRWLKPYRDAGMETWIAPGVASWNRVWPNNNIALPNIQGFAREGQAGGATGMINTTWDDNGDAIFEQNWLGIAFGATAAWQPGESSIERFREAFGLQFHGDASGRIDAAHRHLDAAHAALRESGAGDASSYLFFVDPFTDEGVVDLQRLRPVLPRVRVHAESALVLLAQARAQPAPLREPRALAAMELGARRIDWIAAKFQFADEIAIAYARADSAARAGTATWLDLAELSGINGRLQDMRDGYVLTRELFAAAWLAENKPYWLQNNLARYDAEIVTWVQRINAMDRARRRFTRDRTIPPPEELGIPRALLPTAAGASAPPTPAAAPRGTRPSPGRTSAP